MRVYADGRLTDRFQTADSPSSVQDQIDQDGQDPLGTTLAVMFDQHAENVLDSGAQNDFTPVTPITLKTGTDSTIPGYDEDTHVIYASKVLSYQITQRTLATYADNCVVMELDVLNTGSTSLTGGKLFYMLDIDVAYHEIDDLGYYDPARRLVYLIDGNTNSTWAGFAMGVSLLQGEWGGYAVNGDNIYGSNSYPTSRNDIRAEILNPRNSINDGNNDVIWIIANLPNLSPGATTPLAFGLCAKNGENEEEAQDNLNDIFNKLAALSVVKTATPVTGSPVAVGQPITYQIAISNTGFRPVYNLVVTDIVPASTDLVDYNTTHGSITVNNGVVTANIGQLAPASDTVNLTLVVRPWLTATHGTIISNQAFIHSTPIVTATNIVTHQVINIPSLAVTKVGNPPSVVQAGQTLTYTIVVVNQGPGYATGVTVSDPLPANTQFISDSIRLSPAGIGTVGATPPLLASEIVITPGRSVTVTFAVRVNSPLANGTIITNIASVTADQQPTPLPSTVTHTVVATPVVNVVKTGPAVANVGDTVIFTFTVTNGGNTLLRVLDVVDNYAGPAARVSGDTDGDNWLDLAESWTYIADYTIPAAAPAALTNTVTVTAADTFNTATVATATHTMDIQFSPVLTLAKTGPVAARVGETVTFTFTVSHGEGSDGSALQNVVVSDNYAGTATLAGGDDNGNGLLEANEVWTYTAPHTIQPHNPNPLVNTGIVRGRDRDNELVVATARHTTTLTGFAPTLYVDKDGPETARVGQTAVFTFYVINLTEPALKKFNLDFVGIAAVLGDGSPISQISASDNVAGPGTYVSGDSNANNKLDGGEQWIYTASYIIRTTDPDPLVNTVTVFGQDQEGDSLIGYDTFETNLPQSAVLRIAKTAPVTVTAGQTVIFWFSTSHAAGSDRSPVHTLWVNDTMVGPGTYVNGDTNGNKLLEWGETWTYRASYRVPLLAPSPLIGISTVTGKDKDNKLITASSIHSTVVTTSTNPGSNPSFFLPIVAKN
jgi:uncharacterized repeat protein (TIGR01451 family)